MHLVADIKQGLQCDACKTYLLKNDHNAKTNKKIMFLLSGTTVLGTLESNFIHQYFLLFFVFGAAFIPKLAFESYNNIKCVRERKGVWPEYIPYSLRSGK